jgi:hypothetical protein
VLAAGDERDLDRWHADLLINPEELCLPRALALPTYANLPEGKRDVGIQRRPAVMPCLFDQSVARREYLR